MLGEELRLARIQAGLTQEELAIRAQVSREYVSMLERDRKSPTIQMLMRICSATGVRTSEVIRRVEDKQRS